MLKAKALQSKQQGSKTDAQPQRLLSPGYQDYHTQMLQRQTGLTRHSELRLSTVSVKEGHNRAHLQQTVDQQAGQGGLAHALAASHSYSRTATLPCCCHNILCSLHTCCTTLHMYTLDPSISLCCVTRQFQHACVWSCCKASMQQLCLP